MTRAIINVRDPEGFDVGAIQIPEAAFQRLVQGRGPLKLEPSDLLTEGGTRFDPEIAGFKANGRQVFIELNCEVDVFGGQGRKWLFTTNTFGGLFIERMTQAEDADLFNVWIEQASKNPGRVASYLAGCTRPGEYRTALASLRRAVDAGSPARNVGGRA